MKQKPLIQREDLDHHSRHFHLQKQKILYNMFFNCKNDFSETIIWKKKLLTLVFERKYFHFTYFKIILFLSVIPYKYIMTNCVLILTRNINSVSIIIMMQGWCGWSWHQALVLCVCDKFPGRSVVDVRLLRCEPRVVVAAAEIVVSQVTRQHLNHENCQGSQGF